MIKVGELEKADKLKTHKQTKLANKQLNDELKPERPKKMPFKTPKPVRQHTPPAPKKQFTEYRSLILPLLGGGTWLAYKQVSERPTDDDYNRLMRSIIGSDDLNELIGDQLTYFDTSDGLMKTLATCLSKVVQVSAAKMQELPLSGLEGPNRSLPSEHLEEETETPLRSHE